MYSRFVPDTGLAAALSTPEDQSGVPRMIRLSGSFARIAATTVSWYFLIRSHVTLVGSL